MRNEEAKRGEGYQLSVDYELEPTELTHILGENFVTPKDSMEMESTICAPQSAVKHEAQKGCRGLPAFGKKGSTDVDGGGSSVS